MVDMTTCRIDKRNGMNLCQFNENIFSIESYTQFGSKKKKGEGVLYFTQEINVFINPKGRLFVVLYEENVGGGLLVVGMKQSLHSM